MTVTYVISGSVVGGIVHSGNTQIILNGGITSSVDVYKGGSQIVSSGGTANDTTIIEGAYLTIKAGGIANGGDIYGNATVEAGGMANSTVVYGNQDVYGKTNDITVNSGNQTVFNNAVVTSTYVASNGIQTISSGGTAIGTKVYLANQIVLSGGVASDAYIISGTQTVNNGGTASNTTVYNNGNQIANGGAVISNTTIYSGGTQTINSGATASNTNVSLGGYQIINSGGIGNNTTVYSRGYLIVKNGATVNGGNVYGNGNATVEAGGMANSTVVYGNQDVYGKTNDITVNSGNQTVFNNAVVTSTYVASNGIQTISSGGTAIATKVYLANQIVLSGGVASDAYIISGTQTVNNGGTASNTTVYNGGTQTINSGATASNTNVISGGYQIINSGGIGTNTNIFSNSYLIVKNGATVNGGNVYGKGNATVEAGGMANSTVVYGNQDVYGKTNNITVNSGNQTVFNNAVVTSTYVASNGIQTISSGGTAIGTKVYLANQIVLSGGVASDAYIISGNQTVNNGGIASNTTVYNNGNQIANSGAVISNTNVYSGGTQTINSGATASNTNVSLGGYQIINSGGIGDNTTVYSSGYLIVTSEGQLSGNTTIENGGSLNIHAGGKLTGNAKVSDNGNVTIPADAGGNINLTGENNTVIVTGMQNGGILTTTINGFNGTEFGNSDSIQLDGVNANDVISVDYVDANGNADNNYVTLTLINGSKITLNIIGAKDSGYSLGALPNGDLIYEVCFLSGTMINTPYGDVAIEDIRIGDEIISFDWKNKRNVISKIKWIGSKTVRVKSLLYDDEAGYPVRVLKNAISDNTPNKDLLITSEHCLFFNGKFIPVRLLVNHNTIYYDHTITCYTYYHIETEKHSVIYADGMLTESYLDTGNRATFQQHGKCALIPNASKTKSWEHDAGAELTVNQEIIKPIYYQLDQRAKIINRLTSMKKAQNLLTNDANIHLITDAGFIIYPHLHKNNKYTFKLLENIKKLHLCSNTSRPCDTIGAFVDDRRELGVLVGSIYTIASKHVNNITNHLVQHNLEGWSNLEQAPCRWTLGKAELDINLTHNPNFLVIEILSSCKYLLDNSQNSMELQQDFLIAEC